MSEMGAAKQMLADDVCSKNWCRELALRLYSLIYLTDGYADYPEHSLEYPVLWVLTPDHQTPPWGRITVLDR